MPKILIIQTFLHVSPRQQIRRSDRLVRGAVAPEIMQVLPRGSLVALRSQLQQEQRVVASSSAARTAAPRYRGQAPWVSMQMEPPGKRT